MISIFGASYGFLSPWALLVLAPAAALLVYAYMRRGQGERHMVGTIMFLKNLKRSSRARRKFVPPPRFFFEFLLLLFLLAAAAGFYEDGKGEKVALVLDNSFSMLAQLDPYDRNASLFTEALEELKSVTESMAGGAAFKIYTTSPVLKLLSAKYESGADALARLEGVRPVYAADNLDSILGKVVEDSGANKILVFTDKRLKSPSEKNRFGETVREKGNFTFYTLGQAQTKRGNVAISGISLLKGSFGQNGVRLKATIAAFGEDDVKLSVRLQGFDPQNRNAVATLQNQEITLQNGGMGAAVFENFAAFPAYRLELERQSFDAIKYDNSAWISVTGQKNTIGLIGNFDAKDFGLDQIEGISFTSYSPSRYFSLSADPKFWSNAPTALIFHRVAPKELPLRSSLFVMPPLENAVFPAQPQIPAPQVTRFEASHPVNSYLNYPALTLKALTPLVPQLWTKELLSTTEGPAILAGEKEGERYVAVGFELFPYSGKESPLVSILTLNILRWLSDFSLNSGFVPAWSVQTIENGELATVTCEDPGTAGFKNYERTGPANLTLEQPGVLAVQGVSGETRLHAVDYFDEQESDTSTIKEVLLPPPSAPRAAAELEREPLTKLLIGIVFTLMLLDLVLGMRRRQLGF